MFRKSDMIPRTYSIRGYSRRGPGLAFILKKVFYWTITLLVAAVIMLFVIYTV